MVLFLGTLAPPVTGAAADDECRSDRAGLTIDHEHGSGPEQPLGDCKDCAPDCLCSCCALRCGVAFCLVVAPVLMNGAGIVRLAPSQLSSLLSVADIFHPPRA